MFINMFALVYEIDMIDKKIIPSYFTISLSKYNMYIIKKDLHEESFRSSSKIPTLKWAVVNTKTCMKQQIVSKRIGRHLMPWARRG